MILSAAWPVAQGIPSMARSCVSPWDRCTTERAHAGGGAVQQVRWSFSQTAEWIRPSHGAVLEPSGHLAFIPLGAPRGMKAGTFANEVMRMEQVSDFGGQLAALYTALADADPVAAKPVASAAGAAEQVARSFAAAPTAEKARYLLRALDDAIAALEVAARLADAHQ